VYEFRPKQHPRAIPQKGEAAEVIDVERRWGLF